MKIGILTYTSNFNLGTFFQAYSALLSVRKKFSGAQVEIVNYHSLKKLNHVGYGRFNLKKRHIYPPFLFRHFSAQHTYRSFQRKYLEIDPSQGFISDSYSDASDYLAKKSYDLIFVGSDTVLNFYDWNYKSSEPPIYWLPPELHAVKVMLAASTGTDLSIEKFDVSAKKTLMNSAANFTFLGVRDPMTRDFLLNLDSNLERNIRTVPDPTFSYEIDPSHAENYLQKRKIGSQTSLIGLDLPLNVPGVRAAITHFRSRGFRVASWRGKTKLADYDFSDMNPFEWAGMFGRYSITLTNRFHASIFSLKNMTPVIAVDCKPERVTSARLSKISVLLDSFGLKEQYHRDISALNEDGWLQSVMEEHLVKKVSFNIKPSLESVKNDYFLYLGQVKDTVTQK